MFLNCLRQDNALSNELIDYHSTMIGLYKSIVLCYANVTNVTNVLNVINVKDGTNVINISNVTYVLDQYEYSKLT